MTKLLNSLNTACLQKKDKRIAKRYLKKITGYKHTQLTRLIGRAKKDQLRRAAYQRIKPHRIYAPTDIKLLEKTDELHLRLSEKATREIFRREKEVFNHQEYQTIARISHAHITNLRHHGDVPGHCIHSKVLV